MNALQDIARQLALISRRLGRLAEAQPKRPDESRAKARRFPPGNLSRIERNAEMKAFVHEMLDRGATISAVRAACAERFPNPPSRSAIGRYRQRHFVQHDDNE